MGWFILADDLTGAADCAIAFARRGQASAVSWGGGVVDLAARPAVFSYDADSRAMDALTAVQAHKVALERLHDDERALFKKIDSTLRGQPAAETAMALEHMKLRSGVAFGIFAPAFPDTARITVNGRIHVAGRPLEETELWQRDHTYPTADLMEVLATAGVGAQTIPLSTIRGGEAVLREALSTVAAMGSSVAVCDAETNDDLRRIAEAGLPSAKEILFIGSAGLAQAISALEPKIACAPPSFTASKKGALIIVGSLAATSRMGARALTDSGRVVHFLVDPHILLCDGEGRKALGKRVAGHLDAGQDVLVEIGVNGEPNMALGRRLASGLAEALTPAASRMSAFAATGGETASALLSHFGVNGIRLVDEIEPGVALGLTLGDLSIPVVTKAGAFGDESSLLRIADKLGSIRQKGSFA